MSEARFADSLLALLEEKGWSQRQLVRETRRRSDWGSSTLMTFLTRGDMPPSLEAMETIASALQVDPAMWPEYRMAKWRHSLNPERVGYDAALKVLRKIEG